MPGSRWQRGEAADREILERSSDLVKTSLPWRLEGFNFPKNSSSLYKWWPLKCWALPWGFWGLLSLLYPWEPSGNDFLGETPASAREKSWDGVARLLHVDSSSS